MDAYLDALVFTFKLIGVVLLAVIPVIATVCFVSEIIEPPHRKGPWWWILACALIGPVTLLFVSSPLFFIQARG